MRKVLGAVLATTIVGALLVVMGGVAEAHQCSDAKAKMNKDNCQETPVYEDWRPNYVPLFDLPNREEQGEGTDGDQQRRDAQRWRDECADDGEERQQCAWAYGGTSAQEYPTDVARPRPNELHVGYAANHCFLAERRLRQPRGERVRDARLARRCDLRRHLRVGEPPQQEVRQRRGGHPGRCHDRRIT